MIQTSGGKVLLTRPSLTDPPASYEVRRLGLLETPEPSKVILRVQLFTMLECIAPFMQATE